jgi:hypothetical protein
MKIISKKKQTSLTLSSKEEHHSLNLISTDYQQHLVIEFYGKTRFSAALTTTTIPTPAFAHHEQMLRDMGIGYNDYDDDGVTCAATDEQADAWSDQFFNHHNVNIAYLKACEAKEQKYSYDPNADNLAHQEDLLGQWDSIYSENNENFAPDFGTFGK